MIRVSMHIVGLVLVLLISVFAGLYFLRSTSPGAATKVELVEIYSAVFGFLVSFTALLGYFARVAIWRKELTAKHLFSAERQGTLLGLFGVFLLVLSSLSLFNLSSVILLLIIFGLIEFYAG